MHGHGVQIFVRDMNALQRVDSMQFQPIVESTMGQNNQESRLQYWVIRLSLRSFARLLRTTRFARALRLHAPLRSLVRLLAHFAYSAHSIARGTVND